MGRTVNKMKKCAEIAIIGLGNRGRDVYAKASKLYPDKMKIIAVADTDPEKTALMAMEYDLCEGACFGSGEELLKQEKLADAVIIATQDRQHVDHAVLALEKGYHVLLEKPVSPKLSECVRLAETARRCGRMVIVCHVLRYTPIYRKVKELLDGESIGDVVSITATENVGWFHQAHSFVRGNWANSEKSSPMILQKCCHDMDLYPWLADKTCESVSSYGGIYLFKPEKAPEGAGKRCLDGCRAKEGCPFDAESIYLDNKLTGFRRGNRGWPLNVLVPSGPTEEKIVEALKTGDYGRCVYHCDNNVVDHQVVNMNMTDGTTMSFTMCAFTPDVARYARFMGTEGELIVNMNVQEPEKCGLVVRRFGAEVTEERIDVMSLSNDFSGHGGGDQVLTEEFLDLVRGEKRESAYITSLDRSLESHYCALAAEYSRTHGGIPVKIKEFV